MGDLIGVGMGNKVGIYLCALVRVRVVLVVWWWLFNLGVGIINPLDDQDLVWGI